MTEPDDAVRIPAERDITTPSAVPGFASIALRGIARPDAATVSIISIPRGIEPNPRVWAEAYIAPSRRPFALRAVAKGREQVSRRFDWDLPTDRRYEVVDVIGNEALVVADDHRLRVRIGIAVEPAAGQARITTVIKARSFSGRLAVGPMRFAQPTIARAMLLKTMHAVERRGRADSLRRRAVSAGAYVESAGRGGRELARRTGRKAGRTAEKAVRTAQRGLNGR